MAEIEVQQADITKLTVDAIANAANTDLKHGGGVAGAIARAGGRIVQDESDELAPIRLGEAVATGAGEMPASWGIHAATMHPGGPTPAGVIPAATPGTPSQAHQPVAGSLVAGLAEGQQLDSRDANVRAAAPAARPGLGGDDHIDSGAPGIAAARRQGTGPADGDLDRLAPGPEPRTTALAAAVLPELAGEHVGTGRDARRRGTTDRLLRRRERSRRGQPPRDAAGPQQHRRPPRAPRPG